MFYRFKFNFDQAYLREDFDQIMHVHRTVSGLGATIAVSSAYSPIDNFRSLETRKNPRYVVLNVYPAGELTHIVFSYRRSHEQDVRHELADFGTQPCGQMLQWLSELILRHCENFVISPRHFRTFTDEKKQAIKEYYAYTVFSEPDARGDEQLFLF